MKRAIVILLLLVACDKKPAENADAGAASATSAAMPSASAVASASAAPAGAEATWNAKYSLAAAAVYVPSDKDWKNVKLKTDDAQFIGDGTLSLTVDPSGRVTGSSDGAPLGAALIDGHVESGKLTATVRRKDPSDNGLTGTIVATITGDKLEGTMKLADKDTTVVREGKLTASKK
jgi:hypothetical protein